MDDEVVNLHRSIDATCLLRERSKCRNMLRSGHVIFGGA
jgi:hypothetical protein